MSRRFLGIERVHFVGIGGIGMCGIAELLLAQGAQVSGTDLQEGPTVERLRRLGAEIRIGHDASHVAGADVVVVSSAIRPTNPEIAAAEAAKIPVIPRAEMLGELMRLKDGIAIAGTHGKTTTTSLVAHLLSAADLDPTAVVGGRVIGSGSEAERSGARVGAGRFLVAEADESDGSFLRLTPVIAVVTNIEPEHLDHYGDEQALQQAFARFAGSVPFYGCTVLCLDDPGVQRILPTLRRRSVTYGASPQADWVAREVHAAEGGVRFEVEHHGAAQGTVSLPLPGRHNAWNALAAIAVAHELEVPFARAAEALQSFGGVERRFETKGRARGVWVVDDYGHHPTEVRATLAAARSVHEGRIVVVFQPHRYSRTRDLFDEFAGAFHDADRVVVTEIHAAGESKLPGVEASGLAEAIRARGHRQVSFVADLDALPAALVPELEDGDLVLTLGAGSIGRLGPALLAALEARR